ncbi:Zinc finger CCHC-type [Arabidopsis suecica]|uniref:Zinc finger CCHC-type n=1 Tax=Arabidopsis suecica TaxID=45249 RepID=A0A8T1YMD3_ARASU|nr:Zinc finger CCHC-type [Arabidopsis suecica]
MSKEELYRPVRLDHRGYGHWKTRMMQLIRGQGEDAWTAVEDGWEPPFSTTEAGLKVKKPKANWTDAEKQLSKFNARAMNAIYSCLDDDEFKLVQGSENAKQMWDILQKTHEGNTGVKRTRLDQLATDFENLKMDPSETIVQFSSKLSGIANEAKSLGKFYKEKKLVKKMLRCLPPKYAAHKAVMRVTGNTDNLKYEDLVGILKSEEMEVAEDQRNQNKGIAFKADEEKGPDPLQEIRDNLSLMARNFGKALKRVEKGKDRDSRDTREISRWNRSDAEKSGSRPVRSESSGRKRDLKCHECGGMGHTRPECPVTKRKELKCYECNGFGHVKSECPSNQKGKEKSLLSFSETESDSDNEAEPMLNFVAFSAKDQNDSSEDSDSDNDDGKEITSDNYKTLYDSWISLSNDKLQLTKENLMLAAKVNMLEEEAKEENIGERLPLPEKQILEKKINCLQEGYEKEKERSLLLERELSENHKKIRMLNNGGKNLDQILSMGIIGSGHRGLGYQPCVPKASLDVSNTVQFVKSTTYHDEEAQGVKTVSEKQQPRKVSQRPAQNTAVQYKKVTPRKKWTRSNRGRRSFDCFYCGKSGHIRRTCYKFQDKIKQLWQARKCFIEPSKFGKVWVKKVDLYNKDSEHDEEQYNRAVTESEEIDLTCNVTIVQLDESDEDKDFTAKVAYTSTDGTASNPWYFDSGCSRHMTGDSDVLSTFTEEASGKVTFGDGGNGRIRGKGNIERDDQPSLINVYYVEGLKANLISISQLCDDGLKVIFTRTDCKAVDENGNTVLCGVRSGNNCYMWKSSDICLSVSVNDLELWHKRLGHMNVQTLIKIVNAGVVRGVPKLSDKLDAVCSACNKGKQVKVNHKKIPEIVSKKILELIHMDLMGPVQVESINGKKYIFVLVDDFSRYTWVRFLREKSEAVESFKILALQLQNEKGNIIQIRSDHGGEFQNEVFEKFCQSQGIRHQYSAPRTPQQNGVVERKNRTLQEMARAMIHGNNISEGFWAEAVSTACYIINRVYVKPGTKTTPYEIWKGKSLNLSHFRVFGCICYILNDKEQLGKFASRSDEGIFLGYSTHSSAYRVYNKRTKIIGDAVNVVFDDKSRFLLPPVQDESETEQAEPAAKVTEEPATKNAEASTIDEPAVVAEDETDGAEKDSESPSSPVTHPPKKLTVHKNHSVADVIGDLNERTTRGVQLDFHEMLQYSCFVSEIEPKTIVEALDDEFWYGACTEELNQFTRNDVWDLVPRPAHVNVVGTKWIFKNKIDESGNVVRNKARLVAQGYSQVEGVDFDETFAPVARLESIRLLLGIACVLKIKLHQMDVKSAFLNGLLKEEVYVAQPKGFEDPHFPAHVFKLKKALYGLKQAPRAWYERLAQFLLDNGFQRGSVDKTLFIFRSDSDILIVQVYVDDIVFGSTKTELVNKFVKTMTTEFEMSMVGELNYFLGLQITQSAEGIFISQSTYAKNLIKRFDMQTSKTARTPLSTASKLTKDEAGQAVDQKLYRAMIGSLLYLTASRPDLCYSVGLCARYQACPRVSHLNAVKRIIKYVKGTVEYGLFYTKHTNHNLAGFCDADWSGCLDGRRSTSGGCFFLGNNLIAWHSKKQNCVSISSTQAEYIAMGSCCTQLLWMKQMLADYGSLHRSTAVFNPLVTVVLTTARKTSYWQLPSEKELLCILGFDDVQQRWLSCPLRISILVDVLAPVHIMLLQELCAQSVQSVQYRVHVKTNFKARVNLLSHRLKPVSVSYWNFEFLMQLQIAVLTLPTDTLSRSPGVFKVETVEAQNAAPPVQTSRTLLRDDLADLLAVATQMKRRLDGGEYGNCDGNPAGDPSDEETSG